MDGILVANANNPIVVNTSSNFYIGNSSNSGSIPFYGRLQDFRYYNRALTETEISDIYNNKTTFGDEVFTFTV